MCGIVVVVEGEVNDDRDDVVLSDVFRWVEDDDGDHEENESINLADVLPTTTAATPPPSSATTTASVDSSLSRSFEASRRRGPDATGERSFDLSRSSSSSSSSWRPRSMRMSASVLSLRGLTTTEQPATLRDGSVFAFNGEVFGVRTASGDAAVR